MDVLIDTNVILNYITWRDDPFLASSIKVVELCSQGKINGYIAFHSLPTIWYALRKKPEHERRFWVKNLCKFLTVVSATHEQVIEAIDNIDFQDFEDCLQDKCACNANADYIVTCNVNDFESSIITAVNPNDFVALIKSF